MLTKIFQNLD